MASIHDFTYWLYDSAFGTALRESQYMFPIVEGTHLLGLAFSVGLLVFVDLRLIEVILREQPADVILRQLRGWIVAGFALTFLTGGLLFWASAPKLIESKVFLCKLGIIALAALNALYFEVRYGRRARTWGALARLPAGVKFCGWCSLLLWTAAVVSGRLIPYLG